MNQQQLQASGPPIASSSRLPPVKSLQHSSSFDDQAAAAAAAALLQIKRSPSSAHTPLLPSFQEIHPSYSSAYPTPGSNGDHLAKTSSGSLFPYLPPIRTDFQQYKLPGPSSAGASSSITPAYVSSTQSHPPTTSFRAYQYSPNPPPQSPAPPHSPSSLPRKRKRTSLPNTAYPVSSDASGKGKYQERELPIDVEGDGDAEMDVEVTGVVDDEGEGDVRCICGFDVDDGFTIQCERCHVWQHAACFSIPTIDAVPDVYLCERCNPYPPSHRQLDYEAARRMQSQRLGMARAEIGISGERGNNGRTAMGTGVESSTTVRGGARKKRTGSPKVERKSRGGAGGVTRRRASSAAQHPHPYADNASGGGRKISVSSGRKKEKEPSPASASHQNIQRRQYPLHPTHGNTADNPVFPATHLPHESAIYSQSHAQPQSLAPPDTSHSSEEPWTEQYVPITQDIVHSAVRPVLRSFAHAWRGVTAFAPEAEKGANHEMSPITSCVPMPAPGSPIDTVLPDTRRTVLHPSALSPPSRPPTYTLHALRPIARQSYVVPYTCAITPSREYLREPTSQYAQLGIPKQGVHLVPPPLELCLDARGVGGEGRWVRSGCHPNAVLRPVVCEKAKRTKEKGMKLPGTVRSGESTMEGPSGAVVCDTTTEHGEGEVPDGGADGGLGSRAGAADPNDGEEDEGLDVTFGVFAIRDLKAEEEIVLGWEWDDRHVVHELPRLLKEGYGSGTPALKRAMGEVLSTLFSTFTTCACGASAHNCAITQMQKFADLEPPELDHTPDPELLPHEQQQHRTSNLRDQRPQPSPDLGPLIGATRGLRTTDRGQGGREGVELVSAPGHVPSVESVARAFRGVPSDSGSDANSHPTSPSPKRVHFPTPTPAPEVVVSPATTLTIAPPSPRKPWERRYSELRSIDTSEDEDDQPHGDERTRVHKPPKKKTRTTPQIDLSPSAVGDVDRETWTLEETLPPKMRKNWIKETLRELNTEGQEMEEDHEGVQSEAMNKDGTRVDNTTTPVDADSMPVSLQSPSTALAGLSLLASPVETRIPSPHSHVSEAPLPKTVISPPTVVVSLPEDVTLISNQTDKANSPNALLPSYSPTRSPIQSHISELPLLPGAASEKPIPNTASIAPLLQSSAVNVNPISSPTTHMLDDVPPTNGPSLPTAVPPDATPSYSNDLIHKLPPSSPPPLPKKPPIKRRTLADWKSRKEKERLAQALLQHPPSTSKPQDNGSASSSTQENHNVAQGPAELSTLSTGLLNSIDVDIDVTGYTDSSRSGPPMCEQFKGSCESKVSPQSQNPAVSEDRKDVELQDSNGNGMTASPKGDGITAASNSSPLPTSSSSISLHPLSLGSNIDSQGLPPSFSFGAELSFGPSDDQSTRKASPRPFQEDGEISTFSFTAPLHSPSRPPSHPPSRPRSPPTQPRSFHASSPTPSLPRSSPPPFVRSGPLPAMSSDTSTNSRPRPVPSGPRALRNGYPPSGSSASSPYHGRGHSRPPSSSGRGSFYSHGRSLDRESDRGWTARGRGRGGSVSGRSFSGASDRR